MLNFSSSLWFLVLQWAYALWQAVRNTRGFNLCYYTMQWLLLQLHYSRRSNRKLVVWVNPTHSSRYYSWDHDWKTLAPELLSKRRHNGIEFLEYNYFWYKIRYNGKYYWVHQDIFFEVCCYDLEECYFVKDLYDLDRSYSVAERISEEEALLMMFNRNMHMYEVKERSSKSTEGNAGSTDIHEAAATAGSRGRTVIHGREYNIEFNSKVGGFLSTIPLILQARKLNGLSALASVILLCMDVFRTPVYNSYDWTFFHVTKAAKLWVLGKRTWLYTVLGLFSDRWRYSDFSKGYAYLTQDGNEIEVTSYVSSSGADDCQLKTLKNYGRVMPDMQRFTIRNGIISSAGFSYGSYTAIFKVRAGMYVS